MTVQLPAGVGWTDSVVEVRNTSVGGRQEPIWDLDETWTKGNRLIREKGPIFLVDLRTV